MKMAVFQNAVPRSLIDTDAVMEAVLYSVIYSQFHREYNVAVSSGHVEQMFNSQIQYTLTSAGISTLHRWAPEGRKLLLRIQNLKV
jgi:hypothetical protein